MHVHGQSTEYILRDSDLTLLIPIGCLTEFKNMCWSMTSIKGSNTVLEIWKELLLASDLLRDCISKIIALSYHFVV
jgi:hypothetical protein